MFSKPLAATGVPRTGTTAGTPQHYLIKSPFFSKIFMIESSMRKSLVGDWETGTRRGEGDGEGRPAASASRGTGGAVAAVQQQLRRRLAGARGAVCGCARLPGRGLAVLRAGPHQHAHLHTLQVRACTHPPLSPNSGAPMCPGRSSHMCPVCAAHSYDVVLLHSRHKAPMCTWLCSCFVPFVDMFAAKILPRRSVACRDL